MAKSANLTNFSSYFPCHSTNTDIALTTLKNCVGYDSAWKNDYCIGVPITIPSNYKVSSMTFTITLKAYQNQWFDPEDSWQVWISDTKYQTTSSTTYFSTINNKTPHHTLTIAGYSSNGSTATDKNPDRTITFTNSSYDWKDNKTYYLYLWNNYSPRKFCMWYVNNWTAVADYTYKEYNISYDANGADTGSAPDPQTKKHNEPLDLRGKGTLDHVGEELIATYKVEFNVNDGTTCNDLISKRWKYWTLDGWNTKKDGSGDSYAFSGEYEKNSPATLYVKWGTHYRTESITFPKTSRTGYTFGGWKIGNTNYNSGDLYTPLSSVTAVAQWSSNTYKVSFDGNGGTPSKKEMNVSHGLAYGALPSASRTGYTFNGWFTEKSGGTKINSNTVVSITENKTLYAQWTAIKYTVKYETNGGSTTSVLELTATYDKEFNLISKITKDTFDCKGWNTRSDGSGTTYSVGQLVSNLTTVKDGIVTLYAIWESSPYEVTYIVYGGNKYKQENVNKDSDLLSINEVLSNLNIKLNNWDKFDSWIATGNGFNNLTINNINDLNKVADKNKSPRTVTLRANMKPRFKIVYYNKGKWNILSALRYDNSWKKITPNINK